MAMDQKITKTRRPIIIKATVVISILLVLTLSAFRFVNDSAVSTYRIDRDRVTVSTVIQGHFEDFIPVRATVMPLKSVFLDAIEGGRVEKIFVEEGHVVQAGDPILELSNTNLQLDVISREAQVSEQLNNLRNTRLAMEQNKLSLKSQLVEQDYQIKRLERSVERQKKLIDRKLISIADHENTQDELEYYQARREVTIESQEQDEKMRLAQVDSLESGVEQLQRNLEIARSNLDNLIVKAPMSGQLTSLDTEIGQSKTRGESLGQIDDVDRFKLSVLVDEFYVTRTQVGQLGEFNLLGETYTLRIAKVYPEILNGQFEVDMDFVDKLPTNIRRGQTLQTRLQLGDASEALLLPRGSFFQDTGGNWAFVVNEVSGKAEKREIRLGRRNAEYFEVVAGLEANEKVITSEYGAFSNIERIQFN